MVMGILPTHATTATTTATVATTTTTIQGKVLRKIANPIIRRDTVHLILPALKQFNPFESKFG